LYTRVNSMRKKKGKRGFASLTVEQRRLVASMGGKAAQVMGKSHVFTPEEAQAAGRKGGLAPHKTRGQRKIRVV
jgi:general stress protein YciG